MVFYLGALKSQYPIASSLVLGTKSTSTSNIDPLIILFVLLVFGHRNFDYRLEMSFKPLEVGIAVDFGTTGSGELSGMKHTEKKRKALRNESICATCAK